MSGALHGAWAWVAIAAVVAMTFVSRCTLLLFGDRLRLPPVVDRALVYAPACALAAIVVPDLALRDGALALDAGNLRLVAALIAAAAFLTTRSLLATIAVGMAAFTALRLLG